MTQADQHFIVETYPEPQHLFPEAFSMAVLHSYFEDNPATLCE